MFGVSTLFAVLVAGDARESRIVRRVDVAVAASHPTARVRPRVDGEPGVIEGGSQPGCRGVAGRARGGEVRRQMVGIVRAQVISLVTRIAVGGCALVHTVDVTLHAGYGDVCASQRESRLAVVKRCAVPGAGGMADLAIGGESRRLVIRIGGAVVVVEMTGNARRLKIEVSIHMAGRAWKRSVLAGKWELGLGVIEASRIPAAGRMANRAIGGKSGCLVVRVGGFVVVGDVA